MEQLDKIFAKSNLDESVRKSKMIFGKLLINLRKNNRIKLYSLLESVTDTNLIDNVIILTLSDKSSYELINNSADLSILKEILNTIQAGLNIEIRCDGKEELDVYKFESFLKQEFGKLLTIKKN